MLIFMVVIISRGGALAAPMVEILSPPEHISSNCDQIYVIGRSLLPEVDIYLNGQWEGRHKVIDSIFHIPVQFGYGLNEIRVMPVIDGESSMPDAEEPVEVLYGPYPLEKLKRIYPLYQFHDNETKQDCLSCHLNTWKNLEQASDEAVCLDCHKNLKDQFRRHTQVDDRACVNCHQMGSDLQTLAGSTGLMENPCFSCHPDRKNMFNQDYIHGPVAGGSCTICHNPHGSEYDHSLNQPVQILCLTCHDDLESEQNKPVVHKPFMDGDCEICHDPHSTNNKWMLVKNSEKVCMECHEPQGTLDAHQHPYNVKPKRKLNIDLQLTQKGKLECVSCHNPHSTQSQHLLRTNQKYTCVGCHSDML